MAEAGAAAVGGLLRSLCLRVGSLLLGKVLVGNKLIAHLDDFGVDDVVVGAALVLGPGPTGTAGSVTTRRTTGRLRGRRLLVEPLAEALRHADQLLGRCP